MPVVLKKIYNFQGNFTEEEKEAYEAAIEMFRIKMGDDDPERNILNKKMAQYSDNKIVALIKSALSDINSDYPITNYTLVDFYKMGQDDLVIWGAMIFAMMGEGILQLRNQVDFSDSGLTIAMFNKSPQYQTWAQFLSQMYFQPKKEFKSAVIPSSYGSGFIGIGSEFGYWS